MASRTINKSDGSRLHFLEGGPHSGMWVRLYPENGREVRRALAEKRPAFPVFNCLIYEGERYLPLDPSECKPTKPIARHQ